MFTGKLNPGKLADVLKHIHDSGKCGELVCSHLDGRRNFFVDARCIVGFQSNYPEDDLGNFLYQESILNKDEYAVIVNRALEGYNSEDLIVHSEILDPEVLNQQQTLRVLKALRCCDSLEGASFEFIPSAITSFPRAGVRIPLLHCLFHLLRCAPELPEDVQFKKLGGDASLWRPSSSWKDLADQSTLTPEEAFVLTRIASPMSVREIVELVPFPRLQVLRILVLLAFAGLIALERSETQPVSATPSPAPPPPPPVAPSRLETPEVDPAELLARIQGMLAERHSASHYEALGIQETASLEEIKTAYHQFARQYHPDRYFGTGSSPELQRAVKELFERIRTAYETLRDANSRSEYDRHRMSTRAASPHQTNMHEDREKMADMCFRQGSQFFQLRDYFNAVQQFREAVRLQPDVARYRHALGKAMMRNPRWRKESEYSFKKAIELDEFNAEYRVSLGILYLEAGLSGKAEAQFKDALAWDSENRSALRHLAKLQEGKKSDSFLARFFSGKKKKS